MIKGPYNYYKLDETYYDFGSFANPCNLKFQCLLFIVGRLDQFPVTTLALLPTTLRRELLVLLPAVDVCKLEETPVITDLPMEEIWETLYKSNVGGNLENIAASPKKDAYFQKVLSSFDSKPKKVFLGISFSSPHQLILDLLYSINDKQLTEIFKNSRIKGSFHNLLQCPRRCSPCSPTRYYHHFTDQCYEHSFFKIPDLIKMLVDECHVSFRSLEINENFRNSPCYWEIELFKESYSSHLQRLFGSIETLNVYLNSENCRRRTKHIFDVIFSSPDFWVKNVSFSDPQLMAPYLTEHSLCQLTEINYEHKPWSEYVPLDPFQGLKSILDFHNELKKLTITFIYFSDLGHLFEKPCFRELNIQNIVLPFDKVYDIVYRFLNSPYPVTLCLKDVSCFSHSSSASLSPPFQHDAMEYSKCLKLEFVNLPFQDLPPILHLKKLVLVSNKWQMFTKLKAIQAEVVDLTTFISTEKVDDLCRLFEIVTTQEWQLYIQFENSLNSRLNDLIDAISKFHNISEITLSFNRFFTPQKLIYDIIFNRLHEYLSRMKIELRNFYFHETSMKEMYDSWKRCGAIKMKKLFFTASMEVEHSCDFDYFMSEMQT